ncbi:patatin-like phospholipase family protein [Streptomyces kaniharaensis]|uniref:Patatin-like phospholipase family protein n=1 Tax=Streptomyces kaniharaensis TaxID=212423 RepID=A0A6N7L2S1_9ACTN|nr:patatin-like phospholipase family protein [Streptomyces kaniharaensis]MQS17037.1 patatin-like phospholipase family protein [Streptomyces kaniharaensis]
MRRSLVLAGGGMRVAWQTGVVRALREYGLTFDHVDGTSGGIMTTGMVLSGQDSAEMGRRWSALDVHDFNSALPLADYVKGPWSLPALGSADGVVHKVLPGLGIDVEAVRSSPVEGTFNMVDFVTKTCVAVPNTEIDLELMAAGMSLPLFMPPLRRDGHVWTDAVWVKDANVGEALRRGAHEVWLVWCIGNSRYWGDGPLEQYVHMIEMSANGALFAELATADRPFVLHVVKPSYPLPLDPEFFTGRITADTLMEMGYRDTWNYLDVAEPSGVAKDPTCTMMHDPPRGVRFRERMRGEVDGAGLVLDVSVELPLPAEGDSSPGARLVGHIDHEPWGGRVLLADGRVEADRTGLTYLARARPARTWQEVSARREIGGDRAVDLFSEGRTVAFSTGDGCSGRLDLSLGDAARSLESVEPVGAHGLLSRTEALAELARTGLRRTLAGRGA